MDVSPSRMKNKYKSHQIQILCKKRHKNKTKQSNRKRAKTNKKQIRKITKMLHPKRKNKRKSSWVSLHQQCNELQYKSSNIFALTDYVKPKMNNEPHIIRHSHYYDLQDLIYSPKNKRCKSSISTITHKPQPTLYSASYLQSNNDCKWIKLSTGIFFNSTFYIFNRDDDIHDIELISREMNQNLDCIAYFLQNTIHELYSNIPLSHDVALEISAFCCGYLVACCYNKNCNKSVKFFYEDRYNGVDAYFSISHAFEQNDIIYCSHCMEDPKICMMRKCECGETDFVHQFHRYSCYFYDEKKDEANAITIDEFRCSCTGHKTRCSRHKTCNKCEYTVCRECELFGCGFDANDLCINCVSDDTKSVFECKSCHHRFDNDKLRCCTLCAEHYCDGIKWKASDTSIEEIDKDTLRRKYDRYLNAYQCKCNWKQKYFDAAHNLWYPIYSECQRRIELNTKKECDIKDALKCMICDTDFAICNACNAEQKDKIFICETCVKTRKQMCDLCFTECIYCDVDHNKYEGVQLDEMEQRKCVECDDMCFICSTCYDECSGEYFGLYLCLGCKQKNKKKCVYCDETFICNQYWDKLCGKSTDKFRYFIEDEECKQCQYNIRNMCNGCYANYGLRCIRCINDGICVQCNARIENSTNEYVSLCALCYDAPYFVSKEIHKKLKNCHSQKRKKKNQRKNRINKGGKFIYDTRGDIYDGMIQIKWKKYKKTHKKRKYVHRY